MTNLDRVVQHACIFLNQLWFMESLPLGIRELLFLTVLSGKGYQGKLSETMTLLLTFIDIQWSKFVFCVAVKMFILWYKLLSRNNNSCIDNWEILFPFFKV